MNLTTTYLGFEIAHPIIPGASPLVEDLDKVRRLLDAGAPMIVLHSLFEEQLVAEQRATASALDNVGNSYAEALSYLPEPDEFRLGPEEYLEHITAIKKEAQVPVVASLNGTTVGGWLEYAKLIEQAGADALELNLYDPLIDGNTTGQMAESRMLDVVKAVRNVIKLPLAVKVSPFFSSFANFATQLDAGGIEAMVLFNRFYQPDIDVEQLELERVVNLSTSQELPLRLRWTGALWGKVRSAIAITGGVHTAVDVVKSIMAGATVVQVVSSLLKSGPEHLRRLKRDLETWMTEHEYESLQQMRGSMSLLRSPNPSAYERANYMHILSSWTA